MEEQDRGMAKENIYNLLKEKIFGWDLSPGQKININQLSKELNISPIPLREILSRLHSEKLVVFEQNKGYRVSEILDDKKMTELLEARTLLELYAIKCVIRSNRINITDQMARVTEMMSTITTGLSYKEVLEFNQLDQQFHLMLINEAGNYFLTEAYKGTHCHLHIARFYHVRGSVDQNEAVEEHWKIIEAIRMRDIYEAELTVTRHIQDTKKRLLQK